MAKNSFKNNISGSIMPFIGLVMVLLVGVLALAIDLSKTQDVSSKNQASTDAAALATAEWILKSKVAKISDPQYTTTWMNFQPSQSDIESYAKANYIKNFSADNSAYAKTAAGDIAFSQFTVTLNNNHVVVTACPAAADLTFHAAQGNSKEQTVCSTSDAWINIDGQFHNMELAFSLDYTWSMIYPPKPGLSFSDSSWDQDDPNNYSFQRFNSLQTSINTILDNFFSGAGINNVKVSVVPFGSMISLYNYQDNLVNSGSANNYTYNHPYDTTSGTSSDTINVNIPNWIPGVNFDNIPSLTTGSSFNKVDSYNKLYSVYFPDYSDDNLYVTYYGLAARYVPQSVNNVASFLATRPELGVQPLTTNTALIKEQVNKMRLTSTWSRFIGGFMQHYAGYVHFGTSGTSGLLGAWWSLSPSTSGLWTNPSGMEQNASVMDLDPAHSTCFNTNNFPRGADGHINNSVLYSFTPDSLKKLMAKDPTALQELRTRLNQPTCTVNFNPINSVSTSADTRDSTPSRDTKKVKKYIIHITDGEDNWFSKGSSSFISGRDNDIIYRPGRSEVVPDNDDGYNDQVLGATDSALSDYTQVCNAIKNDNIEIFIILFTDSQTPNPAQPYHRACIANQQGGDSIHLYENVTPDQLLTVLTQIMNQFIARNINVQLAR